MHLTIAASGSARRLLDRVVRPTLRSVRGWAVEIVERRHGIRTSGEVSLAQLGLTRTGRTDYKASPWFTLRRALPKASVNSGDVFLDLGCGMGRVVFQAAARYPFRRVIGVELSPDLLAIARRNIAANTKRLRCSNVELVCSDVLDYQIPDDVTVVFLYNPFRGDVFSVVLSHLLASVDRKFRPLRVIYANPVEHDMLLAAGRFRQVKRIRGMRPDPEWSRSNSVHIYEVTKP